MMKAKLYIILTFLFLIGCKKYDEPVPNVAFTAYIDTMLPDYSGDVFTVTSDREGRRVGVSGVIVYRLSASEYFAFERFCPHDRKITCFAILDEDNTTATCKCCDSEYLIRSPYGDVISGPSSYALKQYKTRIEGRLLIIYN